MHHNLGQHLAQNGDYVGAKNSYLKALELEPKSFVTSYQLASLLAEKFGDKAGLEEAADCLERAIAFQPQQAELFYLLGNIRYRLARSDDAIASFLKALEIDPKHSGAANNLGALLVAKGKDDEAMNLFTKAIQDNPANLDACDNLAQTLVKKGKHEEAVAILRKALKLAPNHPGCHIRLAWILATSPVDSIRNGLEATQLARRAGELVGKDVPDVLDSLAAAYAETGRFTEAQEAVTKALDHPVMQNNPERAAQIRKHLEAYRSGRPFRDVVAQ
jgi:tetratricopeptide (TPR) repeat protein